VHTTNQTVPTTHDTPPRLPCLPSHPLPQILVGGENVYCSEVEAALQRHPSVAQAAVFGIPNAILGELVAAAVVPRPGAGGGGDAAGLPAALVEWCRGRLAGYKVPSRVVLLDAFPTTGSGKVLKRALREMVAAGGPPAAKATPAAAPAASASPPPPPRAAAPPPSPPPPAAPAAATQLPLAASAAASAARGGAGLGAVARRAGGAGWAPVELAARATAALGACATIARVGDARLDAGACYALPLALGAGAAASAPTPGQVAAALATGARCLVLLAPDAPDAAERAALAAAAARFPGARVAVAVVDARAAASPRALLRALYAARPQGAGPFAGALVPRLAAATMAPAPQRLGVPGVAPADTARAAAHVLGRWAALAELQEGPVTQTLEAGGCYVLVLADDAPVEEQVCGGPGM
jgi:hypothetical protein